MRISHCVNLYRPPPGTSAAASLALSIESLRAARRFSGVDVELLSASFPEDEPVIPPDFEATPPLERSILDYGDFRTPRRLPLAADVIERLVQGSSGEILIYTNADILLMPHFYAAVDDLFRSETDAAVITRRTIPDHEAPSGTRLVALYSKIGRAHPGYDCFVFRREGSERFVLGRACLGLPGVGRALYYNLRCWYSRFREVTDLHLTFHVGDDRPWAGREMRDYLHFNRGEVATVASALAPHCDIDRLRRDAFRHSLPFWARLAVDGRWLATAALRRAVAGGRTAPARR